MSTATTANPRVRKRLPCEFSSGGARHTGMVLNLSENGLFVQTNAQLRRGEWIEIDLPLEQNPQPLAMRAAVVWRKVVPRSLHGTTQSGVGVELISVPSDYRSLVSSMLRVEPGAAEASVDPLEAQAEAAAEPAVELATYRVRVRLGGAPRSKSLLLEASSEVQACARALNEAGKGWTAIEARRLSSRSENGGETG